MAWEQGSDSDMGSGVGGVGGIAGVLTRDEQAVLDHVTGLSASLPSPEGEPCRDRVIVGELMAMRAKVGSLAITPPKLKLTLAQVYQAAQQVPSASLAGHAAGHSAGHPREARIIYWLTSRWGIGLVTAASIAMAIITGGVLTHTEPEDQALAREEFLNGDVVASSPPARQDTPTAHFASPAHTAPFTVTTSGDYTSTDSSSPERFNPTLPALVRSGSIHLRHDRPGDIQQRVTDLVTSQGGSVTNLTRQGTGTNTEITLEVAVPAEKWRAFLGTVSSLGEVLGQTESADEVTGQKIDLKARLNEAQDYLKRLDTLAEKAPATVSEAQYLERERRDTRREIERLKATLEALDNRIALSRLTVRVSSRPVEAVPVDGTGPFERAWKDGTKGLENLAAFGLKAGVAGSPLLLAGALVYLGLRRKRRKELAESK